MSLQGVLESVNGFIDRLQKAPLLIACFAFASHDVWRQLESDKKDERNAKMIEASQEETRKAYEFGIKEQSEKLILKDTVIGFYKKELQEALQTNKQ